MTNINRERENFKRDLNSSTAWVVRDMERKLNYRKAEIANNDVIFEKGVARWKSNNHVVPVECAVQFEYLGAPIDVEKTAEAENEDMNMFFAKYKEQQKNRKRDPEELAEMRAAFGSGTTVVDVITGEEFNL